MYEDSRKIHNLCIPKVANELNFLSNIVLLTFYTQWNVTSVIWSSASFCFVPSFSRAESILASNNISTGVFLPWRKPLSKYIVADITRMWVPLAGMHIESAARLAHLISNTMFENEKKTVKIDIFQVFMVVHQLQLNVKLSRRVCDRRKNTIENYYRFGALFSIYHSFCHRLFSRQIHSNIFYRQFFFTHRNDIWGTRKRATTPLFPFQLSK